MYVIGIIWTWAYTWIGVTSFSSPDVRSSQGAPSWPIITRPVLGAAARCASRTSVAVSAGPPKILSPPAAGSELSGAIRITRSGATDIRLTLARRGPRRELPIRHSDGMRSLLVFLVSVFVTFWCAAQTSRCWPGRQGSGHHLPSPRAGAPVLAPLAGVRRSG